MIYLDLQKFGVMVINILFIGDVVGTTGMDMVQTWLPGLERKYNADIIIANGENAADGKGCTEKEGTQLFNLNVKVITGGNHTWDKHQSQEYLKEMEAQNAKLNEEMLTVESEISDVEGIHLSSYTHIYMYT